MPNKRGLRWMEIKWTGKKISKRHGEECSALVENSSVYRAPLTAFWMKREVGILQLVAMFPRRY